MNGSLQEAAQNILDHIFYSPAIPTNYNLTVSTQPPDPPFSPQEISVVIEHLPSGKAPGIDGIDNLLIKIIQKRFNNIFPALFNKCLHLSCFPDSLKIGNIILFQKGGKDQRLASSYRPISLLPTIGKVLEKLMTQRLTYHLESTNSLKDRQLGFREGKSVDTVINELLSKIQIARRDGKHVLVLSIDIKGAFDNLQHRAILKSLDASICPININRLFHSLLQNRKVTLLTPQGRATKDQKQGCPQDSCSGPALWNLVDNEKLNQVWPHNVHIQAFADDFCWSLKRIQIKALLLTRKLQ
ncbi:Retrovirus-related Pol polyprotein from type-1 retrotransposable element R1 [Araneus ventricosus]|uniref:Retrovirus-related Pol polyprotein from type-1 retrotransposable element R1 n=1 Tax=Araneus ventricosus TaxID=182803 RepID=A0A4Y2EMH8_ARAVE|nr:Retrovirus-related Pol polyprotein from type-1 retrotransposable element R1 [Araneus ventricosus]